MSTFSGGPAAQFYVELSAKLDKLEAGLREAQQQSQRSATSIQNIFSGIANSMRMTFAGVGVASVGQFGLSMVKMAGQMEQARTAFTGLLGSAQKAQSFLGEMQRFAASTPFEFTELQQSARLLLAFGFSAESILPMLRRVGDAVSAMGGGAAEIDRVTRALGQMQAKGKVSAEEMMQLAELGIPAWQMLAKTIGVDTATAMKMAERGAIDAATGINALLSQMDEKFKGSMDKQSQTLLGQWSTLVDKAKELMVRFGEEIAPLALAVMRFADDALDRVGKLKKAVKEFEETPFGKYMATMAASLNVAADGVLKLTDKEIRVNLDKTAESMRGMADAATKTAAETTKKASATIAAADATKKAAWETENYKKIQAESGIVMAQYNALLAERAKLLAEAARLYIHIKNTPDPFGEVPNLPPGQIPTNIPGTPGPLDPAQEDPLAEATRREQWERANERVREWGKIWKTTSSDVRREISLTMDRLANGIARNIIEWKGFGETFKRVAKDMGAAILENVIRRLLETSGVIDKLTRLVQTLLNKLIDVFAKIFGINRATGASGGSVGSGGGGLSGGPTGSGSGTFGQPTEEGGTLNAANAILGAVANIGTWIMSIRQESSLNAIEWNTRKGSIHLEHLLHKANEFWPDLHNIHLSLWRIIRDGIPVFPADGSTFATSGGSGVQVQIVGGYFLSENAVEAFADTLLQVLRRRGVNI